MLWRSRPDAAEWPATDASRWRRLAPLLLAIAGALLLTAPLIVFKATEVEKLARDYPNYFHLHRGLWILADYFPTGNALVMGFNDQWMVPVLLLGPIFLPLLCVGVLRLWRGRTGGLVVAALLGPMALMWLGSELLVLLRADTRIYQDRNLIVMMPFFAIVLLAGVHALPRLRTAIAGVCVGIAVLSSALMSTLHRTEQSGTVMAPNPDWRGLAAAMDAVRAPGRAVVISRTRLLPMRYYAPWATMREAVRKDSPAELMLQALRGEHPGEVWLVECKWWNGLGERERLELFQRCQVVEYIHRFGVKAYLVRPTPVVDGVPAAPSYPLGIDRR